MFHFMKYIVLLTTFLMLSCDNTVVCDNNSCMSNAVENQCSVQDVRTVVCDIPCETNHCYQNCQNDPDNNQYIWSWTMCFSQYSPSD